MPATVIQFPANPTPKQKARGKEIQKRVGELIRQKIREGQTMPVRQLEPVPGGSDAV